MEGGRDRQILHFMIIRCVQLAVFYNPNYSILSCSFDPGIRVRDMYFRHSDLVSKVIGKNRNNATSSLLRFLGSVLKLTKFVAKTQTFYDKYTEVSSPARM